MTQGACELVATLSLPAAWLDVVIEGVKSSGLWRRCPSPEQVDKAIKGNQLT